jgi:hypothetical protein
LVEMCSECLQKQNSFHNKSCVWIVFGLIKSHELPIKKLLLVHFIGTLVNFLCVPYELFNVYVVSDQRAGATEQDPVMRSVSFVKA